MTAAQMPGALSTDQMDGLDTRRRALGVTVTKLLAEAGVDPRVWERGLAGHVTPQQRTLIKLARALDRVAFCAREVGAEPRRALDARGQSCPQDPAWLAASRARQLAFYAAHVELQVSLSALAAALGTSKQRVHKAVNRVEDLRDLVDLDALLDRASAYLTGRPAPAATSGTVAKGMLR